MTARTDLDRSISAWLMAEAAERAPDRLLVASRERIRSTRQRRAPWSIPRITEAGTYTKLAIAAAAVVVAVIGMNLQPASDRAGGPPSTSPSPSPTAEGPSLVGLPPVDASPSAPERGDLVLRLEGGGRGPLNMLWVYADGRMIWHQFGEISEDASKASIGLHEQRLTPEGIEFLRSEIISTGLFERDLGLDRGDAPFLEIEVRNGDGLARVTWAWSGNVKVGPGAPTATPEQARTLGALNELLTDPASWPGSVWEDRAIKAYVPSWYSICFRGFPEPIQPARIVGLLPQPAQNLLRVGDRTPEADVPVNENCSQVTTNDARSLARFLDDAGVERNGPTVTFGIQIWLRYFLADPGTPGNEVWISFEPVLPHGEAIWLGPG